MRAARDAGASPGPESVGIRDIRHLRKAADVLSTSADYHRSQVIERLGLKRYIFNTLGKVAREPAAGCQLLWPYGAEPIADVDIPLGEYLFIKAQNEEQSLPQAILAVNGKKYYL